MKNFFEIFELPQVFAIDQNALEKKYLAFQSQFHPDKSGSQDISFSIKINEGYKILSDDFLRSCYLLQLKGFDIQNDEKAVKVDLATLKEVLILQEKIAESSSQQEISSLKKNITEQISELISLFVERLQANEIEAAAQILVKAKYFKKSLFDLKAKKQNP